MSQVPGFEHMKLATTAICAGTALWLPAVGAIALNSVINTGGSPPPIAYAGLVVGGLLFIASSVLSHLAANRTIEASEKGKGGL